MGLIYVKSAKKTKNDSGYRVTKKKQPRASNAFFKIQAKLKPGSFCHFAPGGVVITLPVLTISEANCSEHWTAKKKRHDMQKDWVAAIIRPIRSKISMPCNIIFKRYAPNLLDAHDNLRMSMKWILDQTCAEITQDYTPGRADNHKGFTFDYDQEKSKEYSVKITINFGTTCLETPVLPITC